MEDTTRDVVRAREIHFPSDSCSRRSMTVYWTNQKLAWFDYLSAPITLLWFLGLTYLLMISLVKFVLVPKGQAKQPFMLCGEKVHSDREKLVIEEHK